MSLIDEIQPWVDAETGLITAPDGGRDNMPVYTAALITLLQHTSGNWIDWAKKMYDYCRKTQVVPGLYTVDFHRIQGMSPDNIVGIMVGTWRVGVQQDILWYGKKSWWNFNVATPYKWGISNWVWPLIGFVPMMRVVGNTYDYHPSLWDRFEIFISSVFNTLSHKSDTSNKCLQYLWNQQLDHNSWSVRAWKWLMIRKYPGGLQELYSLQFGPTHPFTKYARKDFE